MLYPNHYTAGELGIQDPNADPSSTVALSMGTFRSQLIASPNVKIRPWLQDFGGYTLTQVNAQTTAAKRQGAIGWMFWNAGDGLHLGRVRQVAGRLSLSRLQLRNCPCGSLDAAPIQPRPRAGASPSTPS